MPGYWWRITIEDLGKGEIIGLTPHKGLDYAIAYVLNTMCGSYGVQPENPVFRLDYKGYTSAITKVTITATEPRSIIGKIERQSYE